MNKKFVHIVIANSGMLKPCLPNFLCVWINNHGKQSDLDFSVLCSVTEYILSFLCGRRNARTIFECFL